ncbi:MAG: hypothetical protein NZ781_06580 [Armatimonadetes bacterium]|nr:hypothetical protein [Armatimonadota bacterium]
MTSRQQVIDELARRLGMSEEAVENFLRTLVTIVAPLVPEVPPYFERYFEARIGSLQREIEHLREEIDRRFEGVDGRIEELRGEMNRRFGMVDTRIEELRSEMDKRFGMVDTRIEELRGEMDKRFGELRSDLRGWFTQFERRFILLERWLFVLLIPLLIALLAAVFKILVSS